MTSPPIYEYGALAYIWRAMMAVFVALGSFTLYAAASPLNLLLLVSAASLLVPVVFFGLVVAVRAWPTPDGGLEVDTLLFARRHIAPHRIGAPRVRTIYHDIHGDLSAPRLWLPVRGSVPVYFDLLARIPDRGAFDSALARRRPRGPRPG